MYIGVIMAQQAVKNQENLKEYKAEGYVEVGGKKVHYTISKIYGKRKNTPEERLILTVEDRTYEFDLIREKELPVLSEDKDALKKIGAVLAASEALFMKKSQDYFNDSKAQKKAAKEVLKYIMEYVLGDKTLVCLF